LAGARKALETDRETVAERREAVEAAAETLESEVAAYV